MSSESLDKAYATQIANIEKSTGKKLAEWITIINKSGVDKHGELVSYLKTKHGFTHGNANMLVHYAKQSHAGAKDRTPNPTRAAIILGSTIKSGVKPVL